MRFEESSFFRFNPLAYLSDPFFPDGFPCFLRRKTRTRTTPKETAKTALRASRDSAVSPVLAPFRSVSEVVGFLSFSPVEEAGSDDSLVSGGSVGAISSGLAVDSSVWDVGSSDVDGAVV